MNLSIGQVSFSCLVHSCVLIYVLFWIIPPTAPSNWMWLGVANSVGVAKANRLDVCGKQPSVLAPPQKQVCKQNPDSIVCVSEGARRGILECQYQFKFERWNCTTSSNRSVFNKVLRKGTKEIAYIYAITSAGVVHAITQSCSAGNLTDCSCDTSRTGQATADGWKWGGCSDNIAFGTKFSKTFVDAPETMKHKGSRDVRALMNLHNNDVGRQMVENGMILNCRCHGVSGSCAVKSCWRTLPPFRKIGNLLKSKYSKAIEVAPRSRKRLRRKRKGDRKIPIPKDQVVFVHKSPNYCKTDLSRAIPGTRGRECKRNGDGPESCTMLCCGRGYNTRVVRHVERCHCKFVYCCFVKCKKCVTMADVHTCK